MSPIWVDLRRTVDDYYSAMKDIDQIRRENLRLLLDELFGGNGADLAERMGKDRINGTKQVSAWLNHKAMSSRTARNIESACMKPSGWLDTEREGVVKAGGQTGLSSQSARTDPLKMEDALRLLRELAEFRDAPEIVTDPVALSIALDFVVEIDTPVAKDNVLDLTKRLAARLKGDGNGTTERSSAA